MASRNSRQSLSNLGRGLSFLTLLQLEALGSFNLHDLLLLHEHVLWHGYFVYLCQHRGWQV